MPSSLRCPACDGRLRRHGDILWCRRCQSCAREGVATQVIRFTNGYEIRTFRSDAVWVHGSPGAFSVIDLTPDELDDVD